VQTVSDLEFVTPGDLEQLGVMPVQRRRFQGLGSAHTVHPALPAAPRTAQGMLSALPTSPEAALLVVAPLPAAPSATRSWALPMGMSIFNAGAAGSVGKTTNDLQMDKDGGSTKRPAHKTRLPSRIGRRSGVPEDAAQDDGSSDGSDFQIDPDDESSGTDSTDINSTRRARKRRKYVPGPARRLNHATVLVEGRARRHLPGTYSNGMVPISSDAASSAPASRVSFDANGRCS